MMSGGINFERALEKIVFFEQENDVTKIKYHDIRIWPLLRAHIVRSWLVEDLQPLETRKQGAEKLKKRPLFRRLEICIREKIKHFMAQKKLARKGKNKIWVLPGQLGHAERIEEGLVDRFADTLQVVLPREDLFKLVFSSSKKINNFVYPAFNYELGHLTHRAFWQNKNNPIKFSDITDYSKIISLIDSDLEEFNERFKKDLGLILVYANDMTKVLSASKPKAIFTVCYYSIVNLAILLAAKRVGIPVIDIQHGKQGSYNVNYTHFTEVPKNGWDLLPNYFWSWGSTSAENISRHLPAKLKTHKPVVIGYPWLSLWKTGHPFKLPEEHMSFLERIKKADMSILVTLQPLADPISEVLLEAMEKAPEGWLWLIRMHPNMVFNKAELIERIAKVAPTKFEVEISSEISLYPLLKSVKHHVTAWSSVAYEASALRIPTSLIDPTALQLYSDEIYRGEFLYSETGQALLKNISLSKQCMSVVPSQYIEADLSENIQKLNLFLKDELGLL
ncbi:hypothetical protein [Kiloniella sp.]|uniref:hypothetical protein n=1 Tax=Kiloniella sp. TaxID=1938587 RepID=UPI003A8CEDF5